MKEIMTTNYTIGCEIVKEEDCTHPYLVPLEEDFDVCDPELTNLPRTSMRQLSGYGMEFLGLVSSELFPGVGECPRIMPLSDFIESIRALSDDGFGKIFLPKIREILSTPGNCFYLPPIELKKEMEEMATPEQFKLYLDRVHWFKYWAEKCIELHGEDAKIQID